MLPEVACAMLKTLGKVNLEMGQLLSAHIPDPLSVDELAHQEQRIITSLLTDLLGRAPTDTEIQMATAG